jgi:hypothetical protein
MKKIKVIAPRRGINPIPWQRKRPTITASLLLQTEM